MNYKESGVDIEKTDNLVKEISGLVDNIGGFGGLFDLGDSYLVGATDGVGTKILFSARIRYARWYRYRLRCYVC